MIPENHSLHPFSLDIHSFSLNNLDETTSPNPTDTSINKAKQRLQVNSFKQTHKEIIKLSTQKNTLNEKLKALGNTKEEQLKLIDDLNKNLENSTFWAFLWSFLIQVVSWRFEHSNKAYQTKTSELEETQKSLDSLKWEQEPLFETLKTSSDPKTLKLINTLMMQQMALSSKSNIELPNIPIR